MTKTDSTTTRPVPSFWLLIGYLLASYGLYVLIITALSAVGGVREYAWGLLLRSILLIICLGGTFYLLGIRSNRFTWADVGLFPPVWRRKWWWLALAIAFALVVFNVLSELTTQVLLYGQISFGAALGSVSNYTSVWWMGWVLIWVCSAFLTPVAEELFFRGAVYNWFDKRFGGYQAIIGSAMLFAITRGTLFNSKSWLLVIQSLVLGIVAAWMMQRTRSLWMPLAIHILMLTLTLLLSVLGMSF